MATTNYPRVLAITTAMLVAGLMTVLILHNDPASAQSTTAVPGTTITVNTTEDESKTDGDCSLREAIKAANTNAKVDRCKAGSATERDAIIFALGEKARIVLRSTLPDIADPSGLRINGLNASITISGNDRVRVFRVVADAELALLNLRVAEGSAFGGGGIKNSGTLRVTNSTFSENSESQSCGVGGGISNEFNATLRVSNSTFSKNSACAGGGISNHRGTLRVTNSTFSENSATGAGGGGGAIDNDEGTLEVTNSTFSENSARGSAGGGIMNAGSMLEVTNSTFSENSARDGGGIFHSGATPFGPAPVLRNTIVAYSTSGGNCVGATITDGGYNIDDRARCGFSEEQNSLPNTDPRLAAGLADNGGTTRTIALLKGSPAINAIPEDENGCGTTITTDQRGVSRPQGAGCDIGAFEKEQ